MIRHRLTFLTLVYLVVVCTNEYIVIRDMGSYPTYVVHGKCITDKKNTGTHTLTHIYIYIYVCPVWHTHFVHTSAVGCTLASLFLKKVMLA